MDECSKFHTGVWYLDIYKTNALYRNHNNYSGRESRGQSREQNHVWQNAEVEGNALLVAGQ